MAKDGSAKPAVDQFERGTTGEVTDLCQSCADETSDFLNNIVKKPAPKDFTEKPSGRRNRKTAKSAKK